MHKQDKNGTPVAGTVYANPIILCTLHFNCKLLTRTFIPGRFYRSLARFIL